MSYTHDIQNLPESGGRACHVASRYGTEMSMSSVSYSLPEHSISNQPLTGGKAVSRNYTRTTHYLPLTVLVLFVNPPFGLVALLFAVLSKRSTRNNDVERARKRASVAMWLSITGLAAALVVVVFLLVYFFVIVPNIIRSIDEFTP